MSDQTTTVEYRTRIRDMPSNDRPRERLLEVGASKLSEQELLAILLRTGSDKESALALATRLLAKFGGLAGLARAGAPELCEVHGLGPAKAAQVLAALHLGMRAAAARPEERETVRAPEDVAARHADMATLSQEHLRVILLNSRNHVLAVSEPYKGSVNMAQVRIGELFREAVRHNALAVILVHNHPSGDPTPSADDVSMTKQAIEVGGQMDIEVLDHIVIAQGNFASMKERKLAFT